MKLPAPRDKTLAGCMWLARITTKARLLNRQELAEEFAARFCAPQGVDTCFLKFFGLEREEILEKAALTNEEIERWFLSRTPDMKSRVESWNVTAINLGRPGYPMQERLGIARTTTYQHIDSSQMTTVFELLEADDRLCFGEDGNSGKA